MQRLLRRAHLLMGCFFAPALLYFAASGVWQMFGWNQLLKSPDPQPAREILREWSNPHVHATPPLIKAKMTHCPAFQWFSTCMAAGFSLTALIGLYLAFRCFRPRWLVALVISGGIAIPTLILWGAAPG